MELPTLVYLLLGLVLLAAGAEVLVRGAARLAAALGVPPLIIGLTVVAFATSAPELAVSLRSALLGQADIALGNVVGSNILNVLLILGLCAAIVPLAVSRQLVRLDVPIMIFVSAGLFVLALDKLVSRWEGMLLFAALLCYLALQVRLARREPAAANDEYAQAFPDGTVQLRARVWLVNLTLIGIGLALLVLGAHWLVAAAVAIAERLGVSQLVIGLTVVAVGTSLPEVATSVVAAIRRQRDIAVGNIIGSNIFNLLCVLGLTAAVQPIPVSTTALRFDLPVMIAVAIACMPIFAAGHRINRWEGVLFLAYYAAYTGYLVLDAMHHEILPAYEVVMLGFVVPLTVVTLAVVLARSLIYGTPAHAKPPPA